MKQFNKLTKNEREALLKFPAYISLLAANSDGLLDKTEKKEAFNLEHIKTFSTDPLLKEFYREADKVFKNNLEQINKDLPEGREHRKAAIKNELMKLEKIVLNLGEGYRSAMHRSMKSFKDHVSKAHRNVLIDFIFPMPIKGLSD
jgi:anaerobic ribonucleoside-triphosphate reductase